MFRKKVRVKRQINKPYIVSKGMYLYIFIAVSVILFIIYLYYVYTQKIEPYQTANDTIYFMTYDETARYFKEDKDQYVRQLTKLDLYARKVRTSQEYIDNIVKTAISFTNEEKQLLTRCAKKADDFFLNMDFGKTDYKLMNNLDIANIPWIFALTYKNDMYEYEEGLPHTRENIIFLSKYVLKYDENDLINTLIHEKIHIYQRYNPDLFAKIIPSMNYAVVDVSQQPYRKYIRSNPDTDRKVYYDITTNKEMVCLYRSDTPSGINDIIMNNFAMEHPYEKIAYEVAGYYYKQVADKLKYAKI